MKIQNRVLGRPTRPNTNSKKTVTQKKKAENPDKIAIPDKGARTGALEGREWGEIV